MHVTGDVRLRLEGGAARVVGRRAAASPSTAPISPPTTGPPTPSTTPRRAASSSCSACRCAPRRGCRARSRTPRRCTSSGARRRRGDSEQPARDGARDQGLGRRLSAPTSARVERYTSSLVGRLDASALTTSPARARTRGCCAASACSASAQHRAIDAGLRADRRGARRRHVRRVTERRGHPHRGRAPPLRARRPGRRDAARRAAVATTRSPPTCACGRVAPARISSLRWPGCRRRSSRGPPSTAARRCRGTRTCSARRSCRSAHHLLAYVEMFARDALRLGCRASRVRRARRWAAARWPGRRCRWTATASRTSSASRAVAVQQHGRCRGPRFRGRDRRLRAR